MEFSLKLQELRKQRGLTQEELAEALYVSRTAVSKWESGRGYPSIDSLKAISSFFALTLDELLSSNEVLRIAECDKAEGKERTITLCYGLIDVLAILFFFVPIFAVRANGEITAVSLIALDGVRVYLKILYLSFSAATTLIGIATLALQGFKLRLWTKYKVKISCVITTILTLVFIVSLQAYAAAFAFSLLVVKATVLIKIK